MNSKGNEMELPIEDSKPEAYHTTIMSRTDSYRSEREFSPLLKDARLSTSEEDGFISSSTAAGPKRKGFCGSFWRRKPQSHRATCLSKRNCLICGCAFLVPIISFIIFCAVYFSAAPLPAIPVNPVSLMEKNATATTAPRILTFNMFMRPPGIKNNKNDFKNERLDFIVQNILPAYDIITVQEAFAYANRRIDRFLAAAFKQGFYYQVASSRHYPWDLAGDGGLLILSKYPIQKSDRIEFPRGVHSDWLSFKGALHALVEIDSTHSVHVYTTHTQASYDNNGAINFDDTKVRLSQFAAVHQFIADTAKEDSHPILLMGDLNVDAAAHDTDIDVPSRNSSLAYTMMMDVLIGKGTNLQLLVNDKNVSTVENKTSYGDDWHLDGLTDMAYKSFGYHPVTFGDYKKLDNGTLIPAETILTSHNQLMTVQSIDRLLWYGKNDTRMSVSHVVVENFFTKNDTTLPFTQISDHYGLSAVLECN